MKFHILLIISAILTGALPSCTDTTVEPVTSGDKNTVTLEFDNRVGAQKLVLGPTNYKNSSGEDFTVSTLNYFISNVSLKKNDGTSVKFPDQYFLIRQSDATTLQPKLKDVPAGDYTGITFTIGVDSLRSSSPVSERKGVLDPEAYKEDPMYWGWNSGYIFLKLEGTSPAAPLDAAGTRKFQYHIGGFGGYQTPGVNNLKTVTLAFPSGSATVRKSIAPTVHLIADLSKVFSGATTIRLAETNLVHMPVAGVAIANNYRAMFTVDHVHND